MEDNVGMGMAVEMLFHSLVEKPRLKDQKFIQFDSMRKLWSVFTSAWSRLLEELVRALLSLQAL
jgi:hypothetical protein